jgi:hypothetical protein
MEEPKLTKFNKKAPILQNSENRGLKLQLNILLFCIRKY